MDLDTSKIFAAIDQILGPQGCPWGKMQSAEALCHYVIEESYEVIDALKEDKPEKVVEELGDVLFALAFTIAVACKKLNLEPNSIVEEALQKTIRRHPHVFENPRPITLDELRIQWEKIKAQERKEKGSLEKEDILLSIAKSMPLVVRAMKLIELGESRGFKYAPDTNTLQGQFMQLVIDGLNQYENVERVFEGGLLDYQTKFEVFLKEEPDTVQK